MHKGDNMAENFTFAYVELLEQHYRKIRNQPNARICILDSQSFGPSDSNEIKNDEPLNEE